MSPEFADCRHMAPALAEHVFGHVKPVKVGKLRFQQSEEIQRAKLKAAREKRERKQRQRVQEGH